MLRTPVNRELGKIMKNTIILFLILIFPLTAFANGSVLDDVRELDFLKEAYEIATTQSGIDIKSKKTFKNSKGKIEPVTHLELEGPFGNAGFKNLEQGMNYLAQIVRPEVDEDYEVEDVIYPGLGAVIVDVNGTNVGLLEYKMNREPDTYVRRAILFSEKGLYSYSIIMHQSEPKSKTGLNLMAVVILSVNSGKL